MTRDTSRRVLVCQCRNTHTHTRAHMSPTHSALHSHLPHSHTLKKRVFHTHTHTLTAAYLVPFRLHWHHCCSVSCYKTTLGVCVDSPGFRATGGKRRHFHLPYGQLFVVTDEGFTDFLFI